MLAGLPGWLFGLAPRARATPGLTKGKRLWCGPQGGTVGAEAQLCGAEGKDRWSGEAGGVLCGK